MPTYQFRCVDETCGTVTEKDLKIKDCDKKVKCPKCKKPTVRLLSTNMAFIFGRGLRGVAA